MDGKKYNQQVSAFKRKDHLMMTSNVKTVDGLWYLHIPITTLDVSNDVGVIGNTLLEALRQSQTDVPEPPDTVALNETVDQLLKAADVQTFEQFRGETLHIAIGRNLTGIELWPTHNPGIEDEAGFRFLPEHRVLLEGQVSSDHLGNAVLDVFAACTTIYQS